MSSHVQAVSSTSDVVPVNVEAGPDGSVDDTTLMLIAVGGGVAGVGAAAAAIFYVASRRRKMHVEWEDEAYLRV